MEKLVVTLFSLLKYLYLSVLAVFTFFWKKYGINLYVDRVLDIRDYKIYVLDNEKDCEAYFSQKTESKIQFIGIDCEWVNSSEQSHHYLVALLQLAFPNKECALIRLDKIEKITASLAKLLSNRSILMFGVGVVKDTVRLAQGFNVSCIGCVDLRNMALRCGIKRNLSLAGLANEVVGYNLSKHTAITCSNWESPELTQEQIIYAASDAITGLLIFKSLVLKKLAQKGKETLDLNNFDILQSQEGLHCAMSLCQGIIDVDFKCTGNSARKRSAVINEPIKLKHTSAYSVRQTPLYDNCQLLAPDGTLLSTVDMKKVEWYLSKGLGVLISHDPPILKLNFEPSGKPNKDREYYLVEKENVCVVCGRSDTYIRKNIVPHEYRKYFPLKMKQHLSHDVLLLCVDCHRLSSYHNGLLRQQIAWEYSTPLNASAEKYHEDSNKVRVRSLARAMTRNKKNLPESRKKEILQIIADYCNCQPLEVSSEMMQELSMMETKSPNDDYLSHGELVVRAVKKRGELKEFQSRWRQHFLDTMQPQNMPKLWSVDHNPL